MMAATGSAVHPQPRRLAAQLAEDRNRGTERGETMPPAVKSSFGRLALVLGFIARHFCRLGLGFGTGRLDFTSGLDEFLSLCLCYSLIPRHDRLPMFFLSLRR